METTKLEPEIVVEGFLTKLLGRLGIAIEAALDDENSEFIDELV